MVLNTATADRMVLVSLLSKCTSKIIIRSKVVQFRSNRCLVDKKSFISNLKFSVLECGVIIDRKMDEDIGWNLIMEVQKTTKYGKKTNCATKKHYERFKFRWKCVSNCIDVNVGRLINQLVD